MMSELLGALEATALARALRDSVWAYPLVNAAHIFGVALLVGSVVPLDLRLLGVWRSIPLDPLWRVLTRTAGTGLALAVGFGLLLFITRATEYASSGFFLVKMIAVATGCANALALRMIAPGSRSRTGTAPDRVTPRLKVAGGVSLVAWLTALTLGRLVGYF
jgi:hypothetical protein